MSNDPYRYFRLEAAQLVADLEQGLLQRERGELSADGERDLMRAAHTLKGAAGVVGCRDIADSAHGLEDDLSADAHADELLARLDTIRKQVAALDTPSVESPNLTTSAAPASAEEHEPVAASPVDSEPRETERPKRENLMVDAALLSATLAEVDEASDALATVERWLQSQRDGGEDSRGGRDGLDTDAALDAVTGARRRLASAGHFLRRQRLAPVESLFGALERGLRDACRVAGRDARLETEGGDHRVDADVLDRLRGPLQHLVRNAVDHGLEAPEVRRRAGKPPVGRLRVSVAASRHELSLTFADDGRGLDEAGLRASSNDPAASVSELAFRHGVTSAPRVSQLSGRGVGLSSVQQAVATLGGRVELSSRAGQGVVVTLWVPVTLTGRDLLLASAAGHAIAFELKTVVGVQRVVPDDLGTTGRPTLDTSAGPVSFADLPGLLGQPRPTPARWMAVTIKSGGGLAAVGVDRITGIAHQVVQPVPSAAGPCPLLHGVVQEGQRFVMVVSNDEAVSATHQRGADVARSAPAQRTPRLLVIDDSLTTRMLEQSILESAGYEVVLAVDAEQGLEVGRAGSFDMILVDVEMPGMNGFEFVRTWRGDPSLPQLPIAMVTTLDAPENKREGMEAGAQAWFVKTEFEEGDYLETISRLIQ